jgi:hypothetical protein
MIQSIRFYLYLAQHLIQHQFSLGYRCHGHDRIISNKPPAEQINGTWPPDEVISARIRRLPDPHEAKTEGLAYLILDGRILSADRRSEKAQRDYAERTKSVALDISITAESAATLEILRGPAPASSRVVEPLRAHPVRSTRYGPLGRGNDFPAGRVRHPAFRLIICSVLAAHRPFRGRSSGLTAALLNHTFR